MGTTAQALSAALQREAVLVREAEELQRERLAMEERSRGQLSDLRKALRGFARGAARRIGGAGGESVNKRGLTPNAGSSAAESLFLNRIEDLRLTIEDLRKEVARTAQSEAALRRSVEARSTALRQLLHQGATAYLRTPQCGPFQMRASPEAEREALRAAVEDQLLWSLGRRPPAVPGGGMSQGAVSVPGRSPVVGVRRNVRFGSGTGRR